MNSSLINEWINELMHENEWKWINEQWRHELNQ